MPSPSEVGGPTDPNTMTDGELDRAIREADRAGNLKLVTDLQAIKTGRVEARANAHGIDPIGRLRRLHGS